jgi:predicted tellurium resistance membrane protein TerC
MEWLTNPEAWVALATLTVLEVVLGVDNVIFISILSGKLPAAQQQRARRWGLFAAMFMRIALLFSLAWISRLTTPLFSLFKWEFSGRDLILLVGGLFLLGKATYEIHDKLEGEAEHGAARVAASFVSVIVQIMLLDIVFSLDSVITAVGMAEHLWVMVTAVVLAVVIMMVSAEAVSDFVHRHPTVKMLALRHLFRDGILGVRRDDQPAHPRTWRAGRASPALCCGAAALGLREPISDRHGTVTPGPGVL